MKNIYLFSIIMVLLPLPTLAQKTTYLSTCGDQQETIVWQEKKTNEKIYLTVKQENDEQVIPHREMANYKPAVSNRFDDRTTQQHIFDYWKI